MRVFTAALCAETNTFSPLPTGLASFRDALLFRPGQHPDALYEGTAVLYAVRQRARAEGWTVLEGTCACAFPAGVVTRATYETLRDEILGQLRAAMPVDMVALSLHGAMVADGYDDCEGDLLRHVRGIAGPEAVIGALLDPHCHLSAAMVDHADLLVIFKEYPHTDFLERADELVDMMAAKRAGRIHPVMVVADCHMIDVFHTTGEPMRGFVEKLKHLEQQKGVLSVSVAHGFPWGDVPDMGSRVLVITDGDCQQAHRLAIALADELWAMRGQARSTPLPLKDALARAVRQPGPVVLVDSPDNPGGGAPGDATHVLAALLQLPVDSACLGPLYDPEAVRLAFAAGQGATLPLRIGGKIGVASGAPVDCMATVAALKENLRQTYCGTKVSLGAAAAIRIGNVQVVLTSTRGQGLDPSLFQDMGIDPVRCHLVAVKSSQHFYAGFSGLAAEILYLNYPGSLGLDFTALPYHKIKRPKWPFDQMTDVPSVEYQET